MRAVQSNSVIEWKVMPGVEIRYHAEGGVIIGSCVARPKKGRGIWDNGSACTVFGPVKIMLRERVEQCGEWERENWLLGCYGSRSVQGRLGGKTGAGKPAGKVDGGRVAGGS